MLFLFGFAVVSVIAFTIARIKLYNEFSSVDELDLASFGIAIASGVVGGFLLICLYFLGWYTYIYAFT